MSSLRKSRRWATSAVALGLFAAVTALAVGAGPVAAAAPGIAYVQGTTFGTGSKVASTPVALTKPVGAGDLLVGWFSQYNAAGNVAVSDNVNGAWTRAPSSSQFGTSGDNALYYLPGSKASAGGVAVTVSSPAAAYLQGSVADYSGVATTGALDQMAVAKGVSTAATSGPTAAVGAGDLVYSALITGGSPNGVSAGSSQALPYTPRASSGSGSSFEEDITAGAAGTQSGSARLNSSTDWYAVVATFRPLSSAPPPPPPAPQPPTAPTGVASLGVTATQVGLSWTASTDNVPVTGYTVYRGGVAVGTSPTPSFTDTTVAPSTTYSYTVIASNGAGQTSAPSAPLIVTTPAAAGPCSASSLIDAVSAANTTPGGGTVTLAGGCVYTLAAANSSADGSNGLPVITGNVRVEGNGATITRSAASGTPHFRVFDVASGGNLALHALTVSNGIADNNHDGGGAVYNHGTLQVAASTFTGNSNPAAVGTSGGAIQNSGSLTVTTSTFTGNSAMEGGGVFNQGTTAITKSTFTNNSATIYGGGAILNAFGTTTVDGCTFVGNSGPGGGVVDNDTTINISNSTMVNNTGGSHGGGAIQNFGVVNLTTSTLSGNASPYGADIYNYGTSKITVSSSIVADGVTGANCGGTAIIDGGYNLDTGSTCQFSAAKHSKSNTRPQLQALAPNGGPTSTMALTPGSPAIDAVPSNASGCAASTDQRGTVRPQGPACDIGSYELIVNSSDTQPPTTPAGLAASSAAGGDVALGWHPSTDNVGVAGYTVYRNGGVLGITGAGSTAYTDTTAAPSTTYSYTVDAFDSAGNHSAQSAPLSVTTTGAPPAAPHWVQGGVAGSGSKVASVTVQLTAPVNAGDLLVGWFGQYDSPGQVQVSDNVNGAWTRANPSTTFSSGGDIALFSVQNAAAAPGGVTVTISSTAPTYLEGTAAEYTGVAAAGSLDQVSVARGSGTAANSGPTGAVAAGELLFSGMMTGGNPGGATAVNGLLIHDHTGSYSVDDADGLVASAGSQQASWTLQSATDWYTVAAVFHPRSGP